MSTYVVSRNLYEFGREDDESIDSDPVWGEYSNDYRVEDITLEITQSIQETSDEACEEWTHREPFCDITVNEVLASSEIEVMIEG